jgi:hypothetical protein
MQKAILFATALVISASPLFGQQPAIEKTPRFDVGVGAAAGVAPHGGRVQGLLQGRVGARLSPRFGLEVSADLAPAGLSIDHFEGAYTIQGRYRLRSLEGSRTTIFATFGGSGGFSRYRSPEFRFTSPDGIERVSPRRTYSHVSLPIVPTAGVGFQREVGAHLLVRADAQAIVCPYFDSVGILMSGGVSFPLGSARH